LRAKDQPGEERVNARAQDALARRSSGPAAISIKDLTVRFGGVVALDGVSFDVPEKIVCGLIGPNGAGKSTLFNCISRIYGFEKGSIVFNGAPLAQVPAHRVAALGIGRTFQNLALFKSMTVLENVMLGGHCQTHGGFLANAFKIGRSRREERFLQARARELTAFVKLESVAHHMVSDLPFGFRKRVELARALAAGPKLLLLDEPAAGLNHEEVDALGALIRDICERLAITVLLVEHHIPLVMSVSDRVVALNFGKKIMEGTPEEVQRHPEVIRAYLGTGAA
jgi:branched-chain amino acid transport system ATP-binding protein